MTFTLPSWAPSWPPTRADLTRATDALCTANEVLETLRNARDGGGLSQVLAAAGVAGTVLNALWPEASAREQLRTEGFRDAGLGLGKFFSEILRESDLWRTERRLSDDARILFFGTRTGVAADAHHLAGDLGPLSPQNEVAIVLRGDAYASGPYARDPKALGRLLRQVVWQAGADLALHADGVSPSQEEENYRAPAGGASYRLTPLPEPPAYVGSPGVDWYAARLARHEGQTRTALIVGPTGLGKSLLARCVARAVHPLGRSLKVSGSALAACPVGDLVALVTHLGPDVLVLDDVAQIQNWTGDDHSLALFEALRGPARIVIGTLMEDREMRNNDYYAGMRPGRVDEVWRPKRPDPGLRRLMILAALGDAAVPEKVLNEIVVKTEGLTGAYLVELGHRLRLHGYRTWRSEVQSLRRMSPTARKVKRRVQKIPAELDEEMGAEIDAVIERMKS